MDLKLLRDATRPEHEATESLVPLMHPDLTREEYVSVLQRFLDVIRAWETVATREAPAAYAEMVQQRTRRESLEADLRWFGASYRTDPPVSLLQQVHDVIRNPETDPEERSSRFLGAMYVVEGSTLGGQYIASHVAEVLGLEPGQGNRYFRGYGAETMPKWREFQQFLLAIPDSEGHYTIAAAKEMFGIFRTYLSSDFLPGTTLLTQDKHDAAGRLQIEPVRAS